MANEPSVPSPGRRHFGGRLALLAVSASLAALIMVAGAVGVGAYLWAGQKIRHIPPADPASNGSSDGQSGIDSKCARQTCNYLLLGSDSRSGLSEEEQEISGTNKDLGGEQRSDTIVVVHTEPDQKRAVILHFPRDLWVEIPGVGEGKINSAFVGGIEGDGAYLVARTIKQLTGMQINHVMYVDLAGFEGVVDALGGVDMCVPFAMQDPLTGLDIPAGCQHFDGRTALAFVRTRHQPCDTIPDFARISRQQQFLQAVLAKLLTPGEILRLPGLVEPVFENVVVDRGLNLAELAYLAGQLKGVSAGSADFRVVPSYTDEIVYDGTLYSIVRAEQPTANELFRRLRNGQPLGDLGIEQEQTPPSPAVIEAAVFDRGSGAAAAEVLSVLREGGFDVATEVLPAGQLDVGVKGSAILHEPGANSMASVAAGFVPGLKVVEVERGALAGLDLAVVVTDAYDPTPLGEGGGLPECP